MKDIGLYFYFLSFVLLWFWEQGNVYFIQLPVFVNTAFSSKITDHPCSKPICSLFRFTEEFLLILFCVLVCFGCYNKIAIDCVSYKQ